jgi:hypothetical protein
MRIKSLYWSASVLAALSACGAEPEEARGTAVAHVGAVGLLPANGDCTHITSTRLSDFAVSTYQGPIVGASFTVDAGEARVTATAYAQPCSAEPADAPWLTGEQITTFNSGANVLVLNFHANAAVTIDAVFDTEHKVTPRFATDRRLSRNGEDAAGPNFYLDAWTVIEVPLPPAEPIEHPIFNMKGLGGLTTLPRGLARLPDGRFAVQQFEIDQPLRVFTPTPTGAVVEIWPVVYPPDKIRWDSTDGLEAIDGAHLVRTGFLNTPIHCDENGAGCVRSGIEILELQADTNGAPVLVATDQIILPAPYNLIYPVGVAKIGANYAVATLPTADTELILIAPDGTLVAGPTAIVGDLEGVVDAGDGRIAGFGYRGEVRMFDAGDAAPRAGESANLVDGLGFGSARSLAWNSAANELILLSTDRRLASADAGVTSITSLPISLAGYQDPRGMDYRPEGNQLAIADRIPPLSGGKRFPRIDFYDLATATRASSTTLAGLEDNLRLFSIAYVPGRQQIVSHYRRVGNLPDPIDSIVYTHRLDGTVAGLFDLRPFGVRRVFTVNYLPATDELLCMVDLAGQVRLVVTSPTGQPRRSYPIDPIAGATDVAPITSGPFAGDLGVVSIEPSEYQRAVLE